MTSLQFDQVQVGLPAHTATMGENLQLDTIPHAIDLGKAECDVSSLRSEPRLVLAFLQLRLLCVSKRAFLSSSA